MTKSATEVEAQLLDRLRESTAEGLEPAEVNRILHGYFSGRRDSRRACKLLDVQVEGRRGTFGALAVDASRTGMLLRIMDPAFATADEANHLMPYTARVWYHFEGGFWIHSAEGELQVGADVVRVTGYCGRGAHLILIGCRFRRELSRRECEVLGIDFAAADAPVAPA